MGVCIDITLFCDECSGNDILHGSVTKARQEAKENGWVRRKGKDGKWRDICKDCKAKK